MIFYDFSKRTKFVTKMSFTNLKKNGTIDPAVGLFDCFHHKTKKIN